MSFIVFAISMGFGTMSGTMMRGTTCFALKTKDIPFTKLGCPPG